MFERFTQQAREIVVGAQREGRSRGSDRIGTEHLLLALSHDDGPAGRALAAAGITHRRLTGRLDEIAAGSAAGALDEQGLAALGIDLAAVREQVERAFGPGALDATPGPAPRRRFGRRREGTGHLPFTPGSKKTLELGLREAIARQDRTIGTEHLLLGILREGQGPACRLLADLGVAPADLRRSVEAETRRAA